MIRHLLCQIPVACLLATSFSTLTAAPKVVKVEPPDWWVRHTHNPVILLLTGSDLQDARITGGRPGIRAKVVRSSEDGRYLFVALEVERAARPGTYSFQVKGPSGTSAFAFELREPLEPQGRFQGFSTDDVIYLLMPDRFANGDPTNDSPAAFADPADRTSRSAHHGGDLTGIRDRLGYLKELGVTGLWLTPVYQNSSSTGSSYHGYGAVDFYAVEPRFGDLTDFRSLVDSAHAMGLKVIQDQVANHTGPTHPWATHPPTPTWFNDFQRSPKLTNNFDIPALSNPYSPVSKRDVPLRGWFAGILPDLNQDDPLAAAYLIQNALWWIGVSGIDGIRQDTYPYVDREFWEKWQAAIDAQFPGLTVVGEITASTPAVLSFFEGGTRRYGTDTRLPSMLDFPLETALREVFAKGKPMTRLTEILAQDSLYQRPDQLVAFISNHDQYRFITEAGGDLERLFMAYTVLLSLPRIPHLYYGDEILLGAGDGRDPRSVRPDFPGGFPGDPSNLFNPEGRTGEARRAFDFLQQLLRWRKEHPAMRRGRMTVLLANESQLAYLRSSEEEHVLVVISRAGEGQAIELVGLGAEIAEETEFVSLLGSRATAVSGGKIRLPAPAPINLWVARRATGKVRR